MRHMISALLYISLPVMANADPAALSDLRTGDMKKLAVHSEPVASSDVAFTSEDGDEMTLADFGGKVVVLNMWATWCAPCREEMPHLSALQETMGGDAFEVVTVATGRNPRPAMETFFAEIGVDNLPLHTDLRQELSRSLGVLGLPVTLILDREGQEIARLQGDADWSSDSAMAIINAVIADGQS
ncbi:MAG: TlpA family protein disulfide reductase [Loktanella sp.]|nr:TlpA family protein disulfide reductase [Loktanella sp.]